MLWDLATCVSASLKYLVDNVGWYKAVTYVAISNHVADYLFSYFYCNPYFLFTSKTYVYSTYIRT